jgi:membrane-bound metal-dependent hydrolase YbcI (DUF457 family)
MLGKTHRAGGCAAALIAFEVMRAKGWLLPETNEFIQLAMVYPLASWGSIFPDLDHGKDSIPDKDPVSYAVNWFLRKTGAKHRSWQTHSILVTGGFCLLLYSIIFVLNAIIGVQDDIGWAYLRLSTIGFIAGVVSHFVLDAFTTAGIHVYPGLKLRFVPKTSAFATGGLWEKIIFYILIAIIVIILFRILLIELDLSIIEMLVNKLASLRG